MSNFINKVKDAVTPNHHDGPSASTNAGPHDSNMANKVDPRADSDRDNRAAYNTSSGTANTAYGSGTGTGTGGYGGGSTGTTTTTAGPHSSNLANKADPRVDSDRDNRAAYNTSSGTANTAYGSGTGTGTGGYGGGSTGTTTTAGPHSSNLANKVDPRVDSDRDNRAAYNTSSGTANTAYGSGTGTGTGGYGGGSTGTTTAGPHSSNLANKVDPRFDSNLDSRQQNLGGNTASAGSSYATPGRGQAQQTAGPHDSNITNKIDPRVDSDLDNSRTVGGNATRY